MMMNNTADLQTIETHAETIYEKARQVEDAGIQMNPALLSYIENALSIAVGAFEAELEGVESKVVYLRTGTENVSEPVVSDLAPLDVVYRPDDACEAYLEHADMTQKFLIQLGMYAGAVNQRDWMRGQ